jgi:NUMOD4 motif-containing protein/HNH endonuclease
MGYSIEKWKAIEGFEKYYEVSNLGRVRRIKASRRTRRGYVLSAGKIDDKGNRYAVVLLSVHGKYTIKRIHKLVAEAFIGKCPRGMKANHKDGYRMNNGIRNIEYITQKNNVKHAIGLGLFHVTKKKKDMSDIQVFRQQMIKLSNEKGIFGEILRARCMGEFVKMPKYKIDQITTNLYCQFA